MIPARDPHWALGRDHGRDGRDWETFSDPEQQRRYLCGYGVGQLERLDRIFGEHLEALAAVRAWRG